MILLNIYGKINTIEISKKLGMILLDLDDDWKDGIKEKF
jgi:hypothetical protein